MPARLHYPFAERPAEGEALPVRPGVFWLRMPIPIPGLEHINLWLLEDGEGWTVVDTGLNTRRIRELWEAVFARHLASRPVTRLICTHFHPDHLGLAGWLAERWQAPLWMTLGEWGFGRMLALDALPEVPEDVIGFYRRTGFGEAAIAQVRARGFSNFRKGVSEIPRSFRRLADGDRLRTGRHDWRIMVGSGHSPEHACLYAPELGLLISGDQVLPRISPHIGVYPGEPEANPLQQYLDSLDRFRGLPPETLVLPAHNDPFVGLEARLDALKKHHAERLERLVAALTTPKSAIELLPALFRRDLGGDHAFLAASEALAHLNLLLARGDISRELDASGVYRYRRSAADADAAD